MLEQLKKELLEILEIDDVLFDEPMNKHTTFQIGGPAEAFVCPSKIEQIQKIRLLCQDRNVPLYIIGNGSNILVKDEGYPGCILQIGSKMNKGDVHGTQVTAQSGMRLSKLSSIALEAGLTGLEFASGIPGTVGGAMVMNAGAYDGQMKQVVKEVKVLDGKGKIKTLSNFEMDFGYRSSILKREPYIVIEVIFDLKQENIEKIKEKQSKYAACRMEKQPLTYPSAGSTFKRPVGKYAGKLIMDAGLQGHRIGDAQVSEKHCGFVINRGNATAKDVKELIAYVQQEVNNKFSIMLEPEVIFLDITKK